VTHTPCWNCGELPRWQCTKCGSTERRTTSTGCAECHRRYQRAKTPRKHPGLTNAESRLFSRLLADPFDDITITQPMRAYLKAFDAYLTAGKAGALRTLRHTRTARRLTLARLEEPITQQAHAA
jgi:hypothetical protein